MPYLLQVSRPLGVDPVKQLQVPDTPEQTALAVVQLPWVFPAATPVHEPPSLFASMSVKENSKPINVNVRHEIVFDLFPETYFSFFLIQKNTLQVSLRQTNN